MRKLLFFVFALSFLSSIAYGGKLCMIQDLKIADIPASRIKGVLIVPWDWLEDEALPIYGTATDAVNTVELSFDGGKSWISLEAGDVWSYDWKVEDTNELQLKVRAKCEDKIVPYRRRSYRIKIVRETSKEIIKNKLKLIETYYQLKNSTAIMKLFSQMLRSPLYRNYRDLWIQIRNDLQWGEGIQLHFYVDQILRDENIYIVETHWDLTYLGLLEPKEGYTEFHFDAAGEWKIVDIREDKVFGIIEEPKPDLFIIADEITGNVGYNSVTVVVPVHNGGRIAARKVEISVSCNQHYDVYNINLASFMVLKLVPIKGLSIGVVNLHTDLDLIPGIPVYCNINIDPKNKISELNEDNNLVSVTISNP